MNEKYKNKEAKNRPNGERKRERDLRFHGRAMQLTVFRKIRQRKPDRVFIICPNKKRH